MSSSFTNVPKVINGDTVVGFTNTQKIKDLGWIDKATLYSWYKSDPNKNHLGLVNLFSTLYDERVPTYKDFFKEGAVIEVNGMDGKFRYDLPVSKPSGVYTTGDTSTYSEAPGVDGSLFPIDLGEKFSPGDVLTYDAMFGEQVRVTTDRPIEAHGENWRHWVSVVSQDAFVSFPPDKLRAGIQYFKIGHTLGEYSTQFSTIQSPGNMGTLTCEFHLGNHRGVETFYTMYADKKSVSGATIQAKDYWEQFMGKMSQMKDSDMYFVGKLNRNKKIDTRTVRIGASLETLVLLELMKLESHQLLFQKGGFVNDENGTVRLNEGIWHQMRRGYIIKYSKPGGIKRDHIRRVVAYLFRSNRSLKPHERRLKLRCGYMAYLNMMRIFREEVLAQMDGLGNYLGTDRVLPSSPVRGSDLADLEMAPVAFTKVAIPEIGVVEIEHDPSLDYLPIADRFSKGMFGDGYPWTSYSMVIWNAASDEYSNFRTGMPSNTKLMDGGNENANIFYVKPEGESMYWGYENGRYAPDKASDISSSLKHMGRSFWAHSASAGWVKDISRVVTVELQHSGSY